MTEDADGIVRQIKGGEVCRYQSYPTDLPTPEMPYETEPADLIYFQQTPSTTLMCFSRQGRHGGHQPSRRLSVISILVPVPRSHTK